MLINMIISMIVGLGIPRTHTPTFGHTPTAMVPHNAAMLNRMDSHETRKAVAELEMQSHKWLDTNSAIGDSGMGCMSWQKIGDPKRSRSDGMSTNGWGYELR